MRRPKYLVLSVSLIALSSCAAVPVTDATLPTPDIAANWVATDSKTDQTSAGVQHGWLDDMNNGALTEFVDEVLANNPDFKATSFRLAAAGYTRDVTRGNRFPTLDASFDAQRQKTAGSSPENELSLGLDARWEADIWGKLAANRAGADAGFQATYQDLRAARLSLAAQVAQAWFDVVEAEAQLELSKQTVESYEQAVRVVSNRYERGLETGLDLRLITSSLEAERANASRQRDVLDSNKRKLEILAGRYPAAGIKTAGALPDQYEDIPLGLPMNLLEQRPDLRAAKARLLQAGYSQQSAEKDLLPSLSLTARTGNSSSTFSDLLKFDHVFWNLMGSITQPIFQGGKLRNAARAQQELFEAEKQVFAQTVLAAFQEVENALSAERSLKSRVKHTARAAENAVAARDVALDQYSRGLIKITVVLESQRQSLNQQSLLLSVKKQRINNRIALHLALGGDFTKDEDTQTLSDAGADAAQVSMAAEKTGTHLNEGNAL
ncbi:efflux transporter outer membrane subunit [Paremcibacter congregatus]|uniref:efflux transporter outer membrane subunit n=1 Tax=Paremcibacter congregatus TaxID=2043170 RepID=UPI003A9385E4